MSEIMCFHRHKTCSSLYVFQNGGTCIFNNVESGKKGNFLTCMELKIWQTVFIGMWAFIWNKYGIPIIKGIAFLVRMP